MAQPAPRTPMTLVAGTASQPVTAEPVPVAFVGRTSTLALQDPRASLRRQLRSAQEWLPPGWFIAAVYWDIESGGIDLEQRSQGDAYKQFTDSGIPRDGGMADLLTEATAPAPRFAAVVCEDIERSGRDMFNALKLEKELSRQGIPLFATDEPADIEGVNATTVLVRRVKQGVAEWFRLQLKEKIWKGLIEHSLDGWNIGSPPYGYAAERIPHPVPFKAAQGRTKARLILDPDRAPVIAQIFTWRTVDKLGIPAIAARLNADPARYPAPNPAALTGWTASNIAAMLRNPKYTGYMVYGRHRTRNGRRIPVPQDQWLWSPEPVHPVIVDRPTWDLAQTAAAGHGTSRDGDLPNSHPATARFYPYRGRVRCRDCQRRMAGSTYNIASQLVYYRCPHNWANPKHAADHPDHPRSVQVPELLLDRITAPFFAGRIFGPDRAALLAAQLPATDAAAAAGRDAQETALKTRINWIDNAQESKIRELDDLPADPDDPATQAYRARIRARFAELHEERELLEAQLKALAKTTPAAADTGLLDQLPLAGDVLPRLPPRLKAKLFATFDLSILWNKPGQQVTVRAEISDATLQAITAILNASQDGYDDTHPDQPDPIGDLAHTPRAITVSHSAVRRAYRV
jgi:site-specific DNA recombinase